MWKWIKIPKAIALIAFVLPWMTVSCSGTKIISATGAGMAFGHYTNELAQAASAMGNMGAKAAMKPGGGESSVLLIIALALVVLGLVLTFLPARRGALPVLATSVLATVLVWAGTMRFSKSYIAAEMARKSATHPNPDMKGMDQAALAMIQIDWHFGFWLASFALVVTAAMAWLVFSGRDRGFERSVRGAVAGAAAAADEQFVTCPTCQREFPEGTRFCPDDGTALS